MSSANLDRTLPPPHFFKTLPTASTLVEESGLEDAGCKRSLFLTSLLLTSSLVSFVLASLPQLLPTLSSFVPPQPAKPLTDAAQSAQVVAFTINSSVPSTKVIFNVVSEPAAIVPQSSTASVVPYVVYVIQPQ